MLEHQLKQGMAAVWLPRSEGGVAGNGGEMTAGVLDVKGQKYLPFVPNAINTVVATGRDVLSFNFTGCIMASYVKDGVRRVCHVSTGKGQDCKAAWEKIKGQSTNVIEFKPSDHIDAKGVGFMGCYGLITADDKCFSITVVGDAKVVMVASQVLVKA